MSPDPIRVESIFAAALAIDIPDRRCAFLDGACLNEPDLRQRVDALLQANADAGSFMRRPAAGLPATSAEPPVTERPGTLIGPYKLLEQIGEGGMGLVFVASQTDPVRRKVALKIIKPGMDSKQVVARFEAERQALAMMDHQNIARVLDAGTTDSGRPYFVMELVHGVPITTYCDENKLTPRERLHLFIPVCLAIQHAHQKGIIHRDIKPSNVLVTMYDDKPVPKVIDFGVAKAVEQRLTERTVYTQFGTLVGTFEYMSPEQAEMNAFGVDTRSDIYSLGVLLYELLTGTTPLERPRLREAAFDEIRRLIKEEEPPRPSVRLSTSGKLAKVAAARKTDPGKLSNLVRGELDWVVMKCLEKDRTRRYETAGGLARDVQRYLADEAVEACPPSARYRLRKLARKYKKPLAVAVAFGVLLLTGFAGLTWEWQAERAARADADLARRDAEDKAQVIQEDAERMNTANAALDLGAQKILLSQWKDAEAEYNRAIEARSDHSQVWMRRGELYCQMGLWELGAKDYAQSFAIRPPDEVRKWYLHALLQELHGDEAEYRAICRRMLERFGDAKGLFNRGHLIRACSLIPDAVPDYDRRISQVEFTEVPAVLQWIGFHSRGLGHYRAGRFPEAVRDLRESLARTSNPARAVNYPILAMALHRAGQLDAARQELENCRKELDRHTQDALARGVYHPWESWYDWAEFLHHCGAAHQMIEQVPLPDDPRRHVLRGRALAALGRLDQAAPEYVKAVQLAPSEYSIRLEAFRFYAEARRWPEAEVELAAMHPRQGKAPHVHVEAFRTFAANGRWDRAAEEHAAAVKLRPDDFYTLFERFRFHINRGETGEAEAAYADATRDRADDIPFRIKCGDTCAGLRQWGRARDEYARILDAGILGDGGVNRDAWLRLTVLQLYLGDVSAYRKACARLVERHGNDTEWRTLVALIRICMLDPDPGVGPALVAELPARVQGGDPEHVVHAAAIIGLRAGKKDADMRPLQAALNKYQWDTQRIALARVCHAQGDYLRARILMNQVRIESRRVDPTVGATGDWAVHLETQLWYRQAEAVIQPERWRAVDELVRQRQWAGAIDALAPLLTAEDKFAGDWGTRATCFAELGRWKEAAADSARANSLSPDFLPGVLKHSLICLRCDNREKYVELCRRALERNAESPDPLILNSAAWLCVLDDAARKEAGQALALVEKALDKEPNNTIAHTRCCLLYRTGRHDDALKELTKLVAQPGYQANAYDWLFLAMAHQRADSGRKDEARKYLEQSIAWINTRGYLDWHRRAELEHFRAEAEALIHGGK